MMKHLLLAFMLIVVTLASAQAQYNAPYVGAVTREDNEKMADIVSVFDFIPVAEQAAIKAGTSTTDISSYLIAMHAAVPEGVPFLFPAGQYNIGAGSVALTNRVLQTEGVTFTGGGNIIEVTAPHAISVFPGYGGAPVPTISPTIGGAITAGGDFVKSYADGADYYHLFTSNGTSGGSNSNPAGMWLINIFGGTSYPEIGSQWNQARINTTGPGSTNVLIYESQSWIDGAGPIGNWINYNAEIVFNSAANITGEVAAFSARSFYYNGGATGNATGNIYGLLVRSSWSTATAQRIVGLAVEDFGFSGNIHTAALRSQVTAGTNRYGLYMLGDADNYLNGDVYALKSLVVGTYGVGSVGTGYISVTNGYKVAGAALAFSNLAGQASLAQLPSLATNTVLGNATSVTATPVALAIGSCDTATKALQWTTNTGFGCNTAINASTLNGATFAAPGNIGGGTPGSGSFTTAVANSFVPNSATVPSNGMYLPAANTLGWAINGAAELQLTATALSPAVTDGNALGTSSLMWSDLFLASGGVINFNNGNATITHVPGLLLVNTLTRVFADTVSNALDVAVDNGIGATGNLRWLNSGTATVHAQINGGPTNGGRLIISAAATNYLTMDNTGLKLSTANIFAPDLGTDAGVNDNTLCAKTTDGKIVKGSGLLGVCLGTSGRQFKTAFAPMTVGLDELMQIKMQSYRYLTGHGDGGTRMQYGPTAQDVEAVLPDLARHNDKGETISYDWGALLFVGLHAIQQLKADNDNIRQELERLKQGISR